MLGQRAEGQEEGPFPSSPTEIKPVSPDVLACCSSWSLLAQDPQQAQLKHPVPTWCSFPWALPLEPICALLTTSRHTARTNTSPLVQSASSHPPTLFCAMPKTISTCTSSPHLQSRWPDGQVCLSGRAGSQEQLARSYKLLGSPQI